MKIKKFEHQFVERVPKYLDEEVLYVCLSCNVVVHLCPCGCGEKVVTPISPEHWIFTYDGEGVSLKPSIGNTYFKCRSHYYIKRNTVEWLEKMQSPHQTKNEKKRTGLLVAIKNQIKAMLR